MIAPSPALAIFLAIKPAILVPLVLLSALVIAVILLNAWRGRLSVPIYSLLALGAAALALVTGKLAGAASVRGTTLGIAVSFLFYLLVAAAGGCFFALLFYRPRPQSPEQETPGE